MNPYGNRSVNGARRVWSMPRWTPAGIVLLVSVCHYAAAAEPVANPVLSALVDGVDDSESRRPLRMTSLGLAVVIKGSIARTTLTAHFANPIDEEIEGEFSLALPEGAVVTGYALDVAGRMVDGVLADLPKAREVYEDKLRQGIDPGLATISRGNIFATRVYPIRPKLGRTIRLTFVSPVVPDKGWTLPLSTRATISKLSIDVRTGAIKAPPSIVLPLEQEAQWQRVGSESIVSISASGKRLQGELRIGAVVPAQPLLISQHPSGKRFFQLTDKAANAIKPVASRGRIRVYWDRSRSRRDQLIRDEVALLSAYLKASSPSAIDVVVFNSSGAKLTTPISATEVTRLLNDVVYRGATSFAVLAGMKLPSADTCLLFSDGVGTLDNRDGFKPDCQLTAITSAADADRGYLMRLTRATGGDVVTLRSKSPLDLQAQLSKLVARVVDVRDQNGKRLAFNVLSSDSTSWTVVGEAPLSGAILVTIGGKGTDAVTRRYEVPPVSGGRFEGEGALWAASHIADLAAQDDRLKEVRALSKRYSIANPAMAFVVLETPVDYVEADIAPPSNYSGTAMKEYRAAKVERDKESAEKRAERIDEVIASWESQKKWWNTRFIPSSREAVAKAKVAAEMQRRTPAPNQASTQAAGPAAAPVETFIAEDLARQGAPQSSVLETVVMTGSRIDSLQSTVQSITVTANVVANQRASGTADTRIEIAQWSPDRPYLKALDAASKSTLTATLLAQEKSFGALPAFYLDVAEWFQRKGHRDQAVELLLSALDLPTRDQDTVTVVAERMLRYGQMDRAIWLYEQNLAALDYLPQPRRALALALVKRAQTPAAKNPGADYQRALRLLNEIMMAPWADDYDGIELIALMDANVLIPMMQKAGVSHSVLDPRLIALLDVDLRVVIEWNTGNTDIDLWIDEPNGEQVLYSRPASSGGGRLSNDMTDGYGPEEYLLHRAPLGKYQIRLHVFAADRINPNGATVVTAYLIRDFGRPSQREEVIDLELADGDEGNKFVGEFVVAAK